MEVQRGCRIHLMQMANTTASGAFGFHAAVCFCGWIGVCLCYTQTVEGGGTQCTVGERGGS